MNQFGRKRFSIDIDYRLILVLALAICVVFLSGNFTRCIIEGQSMNNTFFGKEEHDEEYRDTVVLSKYLGKLKTGDIVTVELTDEQKAHLAKYGNETVVIIKRIIAVPGEEIKFLRQEKDGESYVALYKFDADGSLWREIEEDYIKSLMQSSGDFAAVKLGDTYRIDENCYFVMGDNRNNSSDSRLFGQVGYSQIQGKVIGGVWLGANFETIKIVILVFLGLLTVLCLELPDSEKYMSEFEKYLER